MYPTMSCSYHAPSPPRADLRLIDFVHLLRRQGSPEHACLLKLFWGLDYHYRDAGEYSLDGTHWHRRERHTLHLYAPHTSYFERSGPADLPFPETYMIFHAEAMPDLEALVANARGFARFLDPTRVLEPILEEVFATAHGQGGAWLAQATLYRIVDRLLAAQPLPDRPGHYSLAPDQASLPSLASRVEACISAHYAEPLTLDTIARAVGVSRSTLTHRYREETGASPMSYLAECRLGVARSLILRGESLKQVASQTGYYDEYHLSKAFRRRFGLPPRAYARRAAGA